MFHIHKWKIDSFNFIPPLAVKKLSNYHATPAERATFLDGVTHVYMRCEKCGDIKEKEVLGKYSPKT